MSPSRRNPRTQPASSEAGKAASKQRDLKVIQRQPLEEAFGAAVQRSLKRYAPELSPRALAMIRRDAFRDFMDLVNRKVRNVRGVPKSQFLAELERSHASIVSERNAVKRELERLHLRAEVYRHIRSQKNGPQGDTQFALRGGLQELFKRAERGELDLASLKEEVALVTAEFTNENKNRSTADYDEQIEVFQRRIAKLNHSLADSERTLRELARKKAGDPGVASIYREVQGLDEDDALRGVKNELLMQVFEANLALRDAVRPSQGTSAATA